MDAFQIFILSVVQGLTEFLPVSSSGHLVLAPKLLGVADQGLLMDVALHVGTFFAILVYYRRDVWAMIIAVLQMKKAQDKDAQRLAFYIVLATIPAVLFGLALHILVPDGIRDVRVIIVTTIFFGIVMGLADYFKPQVKGLKEMTLKGAFLVGIAQAVALIPGTSRSGITMTTARLMGFTRADAARFSFLLGLPAMAAAGAMGFIEILKSDNPGLWHDAALAVVMAFVAGLCAIHFMMRFLPRFGLMPFAVYRLFLGAFLIFYF